MDVVKVAIELHEEVCRAMRKRFPDWEITATIWHAHVDILTNAVTVTSDVDARQGGETLECTWTAGPMGELTLVRETHTIG